MPPTKKTDKKTVRKNIPKNEKFILAIDGGGSGLRVLVFNRRGEIVERAYEKTPPSIPSPGALIHDPEHLWQALLRLLRKVFRKKEFGPERIAAIGISNQRGSFTLWNKSDGKPVTPLISWADTRAATVVDEMNANRKWRRLKKLAAATGALTRHPMLQTTAMVSFTTDHATTRLKWLLDEQPQLRAPMETGDLLFGTLDTWFIYRLSGGRVHATDYGNAAATGMFNPFQLIWNDIICGFFKIPMAIFPDVRDTAGDFGETDPALFGGTAIPIRAAAGDQQAALFGHGCFEPGEVKISQGSGAFVDINVGPKAKLSRRGLFPLLAWSFAGKPTYMLEGHVATAGTLIDWLGSGIGISDSPDVLNNLAAQTEDTEGVVFIPTPAGIRFPYFRSRMRATILGLSLGTHKRHVARAVLEGLAMRLYEILRGIEKDTKLSIARIRVDGGVSKSDILLQCLADFAGLRVARSPEADMTGTGAAYFAGLAVGFWKDLEELRSLARGYTEFSPRMEPETRRRKIQRWERAMAAVLQLDD